MIGENTTGKKIFDVFNFIIMLLVAFLCIAPMIHVLFMSISDPGYVNTNQGIMLWPKGDVNLNGYRLIFRNPNIMTGYLNTIFYVIVGVVISSVLTLDAAYVLSRKRVKYRGILVFMVTFTMLFSGGLIPFYLQVKSLGMLHTRLAVLLPYSMSVMNIIILRTAFMSVPDSLEESARLEGAGDLDILIKVLLPLIKATFSVIILFYAVGKWNEWFYPSVFLEKREQFPLQLMLREILLQNMDSTVLNGMEAADGIDIYKPLIKYATVIVATIPILTIYPFVQKYFVTGVMIGSIKG